MRVPDFIFGLTVPGEKFGDTNTTECTDESFWYRNLVQMDWKETTGLVFDLEWKGAVKLAFPWAVYQAKKNPEFRCPIVSRAWSRDGPSHVE
jgi:hypothetical protein